MTTFFDTAPKVSPALLSCLFITRALNDHGIIARAQSFVDVPVTDEGIQTTAFLQASETLVKLFGSLDSRLSFRVFVT